MTKQALQKKLAHKIDYEQLSQILPPEAESIQIDNFVSKFAPQDPPNNDNSQSINAKNPSQKDQTIEESETDQATDMDQKIGRANPNTENPNNVQFKPAPEVTEDVKFSERFK